ncbi:MAG: FecR domain-containing protein [Chitinophagaceae bacterium]
MQRKANGQDRSLFWQWLWRLDISEQETALNETERLQRQQRIWGNILLATDPAIALQKSRGGKRAIAVAAVLLGLLITGGIWMMRQTSEKQIVQNHTYTTDGKSVKRLILPDGTGVTLNIYSSLEYDAGYNKAERRVTLQGEGYFTVYKDSLRPFIVQTDELETRALGTAFNVEARKSEGQIQVALTEGKVAVTSVTEPARKSLLTPGEFLRYDRSTRQMSTTSFATDVTAWTNGGLSFNGIPLTDALDRLAVRYQLKIDYRQKQLANKTVTASFGKTSWQNVLSNLLFAHHLSYTVKDSVIIVR